MGLKLQGKRVGHNNRNVQFNIPSEEIVDYFLLLELLKHMGCCSNGFHAGLRVRLDDLFYKVPSNSCS